MPKPELAAVIHVLLQGRRIKLTSQLEWAATLVEELMNFKMKVKAAEENDAGVSWRERPYDDLVLATAVAAWLAEWSPCIHAGAVR